MYYGEVNIAQEDLTSFLAAAQDLRVKGLTQPASTQPVPKQLIQNNPETSKQNNVKQEQLEDKHDDKPPENADYPLENTNDENENNFIENDNSDLDLDSSKVCKYHHSWNGVNKVHV